ncbi:hypothetical protein cym2001_25630 [Pseudomonas sp. CYM-20-01]|nr:hypothetical protein cym2001_25630 [Pseudomonas sp. CYM-20-01]
MSRQALGDIDKIRLTLLPAIQFGLYLRYFSERKFIALEGFFDAVNEERLEGAQGSIVKKYRIIISMMHHVKNEVLDFQGFYFFIGKSGQVKSSSLLVAT